jgi:hypothetical protein
MTVSATMQFRVPGVARAPGSQESG